MRRVRKAALATMALLVGGVSTVNAQEQAEITVGADVVSSYVWRGVYQSGVSVQPTLGVSWKGLSFGAWGSTDFDDFKEMDLSLGYSVAGFEIGLTDYWWDGQGAPYFKNFHNGHHLEASVGYTFCESFPLSVSWSTFIAGHGDVKENGKRAWSSYVELSYPFSVGPVDMFVGVGAAPFTSPLWLDTNNKGFQVSNISIGASKEIKITESYSLPIFTQLIFNPASDDVNLVFGLSF